MKKVVSRTMAYSASTNSQDFVAWCGTAMWGLAAIYLLATFTPY